LINMSLPPAAVRYQELGYLILQKAIPDRQIEALFEEARKVCLGHRGAIAGLESLNGLGEGEMLKRIIAIHFPHKLSGKLREMLFAPPVVYALTQIIGPHVKCMQSMFFVKHAGRPGQAWHQDEMFIPTFDRSLTGVWIALDRATVENGCLWVIPGSHQPGKLWPMREHEDPRFDPTPESHGFPWSDEDAIPVELDPGDVLLFNGYLLHRSLNNVCRKGYRRSYVSHYMNAESLLAWTGGVYETPVDDYRDIVMVAGQDPHADKGIEDISVPYLRPEN